MSTPQINVCKIFIHLFSPFNPFRFDLTTQIHKKKVTDPNSVDVTYCGELPQLLFGL